MPLPSGTEWEIYLADDPANWADGATKQRLKDWSTRANNCYRGNDGSVDSTDFTLASNGGVFDGSNDRGVSVSSNGWSGVTACSALVVFKPSNVSVFQCALATGSHGNLGNFGLGIGGYGSGSIGVEYYGHGYMSAAGVVATGNWYCFIATKAPGPINTTTIMYLNNRVVPQTGGASTGTPSIGNDNSNLIGIFTGAGSPFQGTIAAVAFWKRTLSPLEASQAYASVQSRLAASGVTLPLPSPDPLTTEWVPIWSSAGVQHVIEDEGIQVTQRSTLNFAGAGVTLTDAGAKTVITIPGTTYDTFANIMAVTTAPVGQLAICTDSLYSARWNGTSWQWFLHHAMASPIIVTGQTTTLNGAITNVATTIIVSAQFTSMPATPFFVMVGNEQLKVTAATTTTWTVTRGDGGTTAAAQVNGATVTEMLYSWSDKTATSYYLNPGGMLVVDDTTAGSGSVDHGIKLKVKLAYTAPWTIIAAAAMHLPASGNYSAAGISLWDVAQPTKDVRTFVAFSNSNAWQTYHGVYQWTSGGFAAPITGGIWNTPYSATGALNLFQAPTTLTPMWFKWVDNGTVWIVYQSYDKVIWIETMRVARNTHITPTHVGPFASVRGVRSGVVLLSLEQFNTVV